MKKIKATFKGTNHSLGYITGQEYELVVKQVVRSNDILIHRIDGTGECVYSDTILFLDNWTNIKTGGV